jgi:hypothetical protein
MDPTTMTFLLLALIGAIAISAYETKAALAAPVCKDCPHCQAVMREKAREQEELRDWYAKKWQMPDRDDEDVKRR